MLPSVSKIAVSALLTFVWITHPACAQESVLDRNLHGTVNVALANANGLVLVTDSRLSSDGRRIGYGQKLFKLDDKTVCSIAGSYAMPPAQSKNGRAFGQVVISSTMNKLASSLYFKSLDFEAKARAVSAVVTLAFDRSIMLSQIAERSAKKPEDIEMILAGYEGPTLRLAKLRTVAINLDKGFRFEESEPVFIHADGHFVYALGGIEIEAQKIIDLPDSFAHRSENIVRYAQAKKAGSVDELSVNEMRSLAEDIAFITALSYPNLVGGSIQTAVLSDGKIAFFDDTMSSQEAESARRWPQSDPVGRLLFFSECALHQLSCLRQYPCRDALDFRWVNFFRLPTTTR